MNKKFENKKFAAVIGFDEFSSSYQSLRTGFNTIEEIILSLKERQSDDPYANESSEYVKFVTYDRVALMAIDWVAGFQQIASDEELSIKVSFEAARDPNDKKTDISDGIEVSVEFWDPRAKWNCENQSIYNNSRIKTCFKINRYNDVERTQFYAIG